MAYTISTHNGSTLARGHNIRDRRITDKEAHIDPKGVHEIWHDETERHAYARLFGKAQAAYNAQQSRADRQINNYYSTVSKDAKKHTAYEMIIAVGSLDNPVDPIKGKIILWEFMAGWTERNPNLEMIGAYYHADEQGVPHIHLDYIPVAHGYTRGMETQTGLVRALGEQGFRKRGKLTAQIQWEARENQTLEDICKAHGLEIHHPERGKGVKHAHTEAYQIKRAASKAAKETIANACKQADHIAYQKDVEACEEAQKTISEANAERVKIIRNASAIATAITDKAKKESAQSAHKAVSEAQKESKGILFDAKLKAAQIVSEATEKAQKESNGILSEAKAKAAQIVSEATEKAQKESNGILARAKAEAVPAAQEEAEGILSEARAKADKILSEGQEQASQIDTEIEKKTKELNILKSQIIQTQKEVDEKQAIDDIVRTVRNVVSGIKVYGAFAPKIISETPEHKRFGGRVDPATVTISKYDFDTLNSFSNANYLVRRYSEVERSLVDTCLQMIESAKVIHMSRLTAHETAVDERVQSAEEALSKTQRELEDVRLQLDAAQTELREMQEKYERYVSESSSKEDELDRAKQFLAKISLQDHKTGLELFEEIEKDREKALQEERQRPQQRQYDHRMRGPSL